MDKISLLTTTSASNEEHEEEDEHDDEGEEDDEEAEEDEEEDGNEEWKRDGADDEGDNHAVVDLTDVTTVQSPPPKYRSTRWGPSSHTKPTDQFFTPEVAIDPLFNLIDLETYKIVFEPCCGQKHISNVFEQKGFTVISRDKYTMEESFDFLVATDLPEYDVLVTNPPFAVKYDILEKCFSSNKPFALLLPFETLTTARGHDIFQGKRMAVGLFYKRVDFIRPDGNEYNTASCAWFFGNFPFCENNYPYMKLFYLKM